MLSEVHVKPIFITSDGKEFTNATDATNHAIKNNLRDENGNLFKMSRKKRTYYSSNDHKIMGVLDESVVKEYEAQVADKRHEAYDALKDMYGKIYKTTQYGETLFIIPICLAKDTTSCGGKVLFCKTYRYQNIYQGAYGYEEDTTTRTPLVFVNGVKEGDYEPSSYEELKLATMSGAVELTDVCEERMKDLANKIEEVRKLEADTVLKMLEPTLKVDVPKYYIRYDEDGKEIEGEPTKE